MAAHVSEIVHSGRLVLLDRLEGEVSPEQIFATVPGIGHALARRIHESLGIETLEDLEAAAHDGRLETVSGFGARRVVRAVREQLSTILSRASRLRSQRSPFADRRHAASVPRPDVETILAVDADYRREAVPAA